MRPRLEKSLASCDALKLTTPFIASLLYYFEKRIQINYLLHTM